MPHIAKFKRTLDQSTAPAKMSVSGLWHAFCYTPYRPLEGRMA